VTPKLNRKLHLVIPVEQGDLTLHVHSTPVSGEIFDTFFLYIAKTFAKINAEGLGILAGPKVAAKILKALAEADGVWESEDPNVPTVRDGLMAEIKRLTNVLVPGKNGWEMQPLETAVKAGLLDQEDATEVENIITFFTVNWLMHKRELRARVIESAAGLWGGQLTSSSCTEYRDSLPTSTPDGSSGGKMA
jgi:hypothetical protein